MQRGLFITLSNIGDAVLTTPALEYLHARHPDLRFDIVADARSAELFTHCPYRGEILLKHKRAGWRGLLRLIRTLRRTRYVLAADLRTDGLAYLLRAERRMTKLRRGPAGPHSVEEHMAVVAPGVRRAEIPPTRIWLTDALREQARERLAALPPGPLLAIGPGANWLPKIWPLESFAELLRRLEGRVAAAVLLGGPNDRERAEGLVREAALPMLDLCGATGLLEATAVLERADLFVGNDSGLGHLASAVATPTLTLFGPGEPERYHPWGPRAAWLVAPDRDLARLTPGVVAERLLRHLERWR